MERFDTFGTPQEAPPRALLQHECVNYDDPSKSPVPSTLDQPQSPRPAPPLAPEPNLPRLPTWDWHLTGWHYASLTSEGAQFILENAPRLEGPGSGRHSDHVEVHLIDGKPRLSWRGRLVGNLDPSDRGKTKVLGAIDLTNWRLELPAQVGWYTQRDDYSDDDRAEKMVPELLYDWPDWYSWPKGSSHDGPRNLRWFAQNSVPPGNAVILPWGSDITVRLEDGALTKLQPYLEKGASMALYTTLHTKSPATPRGAPVCQVKIDGITVGALIGQSAGRMAPIVNHLHRRGYVPTAWSVLHVTSKETDLWISSQWSHQIDEAWITAPKPVRVGPNG